MERRLLGSIDRKVGLKNLKGLLLFFPFLFVLMFFTELSLSNVNAKNNENTGEVLGAVTFGIQSLNDQKTFPPRVITLIQGDEENKELVYGVRTSDIVKEIGLYVDENDLVIPDDSHIISDGSIIQVIRVDIEYIVKEEKIHYTEQEIETESLNTGSVVLEQEGEDGTREKTIKVMYHNGKAVGSEVVKSIVTKQPVSRIVLIGTKPVTIASCGYWGLYIDKITNDKRERDWMKKVMFWESGCDSGRISKSGSYKGLFQFSPRTFASKRGENIFDGAEQIRIVHQMYTGASDAYLTQQWKDSNNTYIELYGGKN